ncbi:Hypothetical protein PHPALM_6526 [Phytophthora palmivora]|uniref:NPP1-like protein n=1 Tax=Phytophthora palmivora TaxID=4796 RepID=A0A2P4YEM9_9STRA|nr:Hypothetical protein PHPALM_6526 [Phytophthora palmivora]
MSKSDSKYHKQVKTWADYFAGYRSMGRGNDRTDIYGSNTSLRFKYTIDLGTYLDFAYFDGEYQDLIMWEQLTDPARGALNDDDNFGRAEVPFNDNNYEKYLTNAWPL